MRNCLWRNKAGTAVPGGPPLRFAAFFKCGIPVGAEVVLEAKPDVVATVKDERQIEYNGKPYSLSALAQEVLQTPYPLQGLVFWTYQGKKLRDIRLEREKQGLYQGFYSV